MRYRNRINNPRSKGWLQRWTEAQCVLKGTTRHEPNETCAIEGEHSTTKCRMMRALFTDIGVKL